MNALQRVYVQILERLAKRTKSGPRRVSYNEFLIIPNDNNYNDIS